ncbi:MAG: 23S rRNA (guanosine(2251)-2'-O)-methyltransferase RlmB [Firmicutes bacterium]|nr:23S rRNA (guanosine(2251)-2'-O)-methyltransferase RlmB [Bacillota bacterium]
METEDKAYIAGRNPVLEALKSGRLIESVYIQQDAGQNLTGTLGQIASMCRKNQIPVKPAGKRRLDEMSAGEHHQGVVAVIQSYPYAELSDVLQKLKDKDREKLGDPFIVILENIQDPHNLGAVIRSAEGCGADAVLIASRHAVGLTQAVAKTAAGACEYVPVVKMGNITQTIKKLKDEGFWIAAADMDGMPAFQANLKGPLALVIGGEHEGVSRLVRENSDYIISLPMRGHIDSLNASVAAGILMYEVVRQRYYTK